MAQKLGGQGRERRAATNGTISITDPTKPSNKKRSCC